MPKVLACVGRQDPGVEAVCLRGLKKEGGGTLGLAPFRLGCQGCCGVEPSPVDSLSPHLAALFGRSREACNEGEGDPPLYVNVDMFSGRLMNTWIDSLQAFFPGLQVPRLQTLGARSREGCAFSRYDTRALPGSFRFGASVHNVSQLLCWWR